jgi:hypothetical protein
VALSQGPNAIVKVTIRDIDTRNASIPAKHQWHSIHTVIYAVIYTVSISVQTTLSEIIDKPAVVERAGDFT